MTDPDQLGLGLRYDDEPPRRRRRRAAGRFVLFLVVLVVLVGVPAGVFLSGTDLLHRLGRAAPADFAGDGSGRAVVQVHPGDSLTKVGETLYSAGVVKSVEAFTRAATGDERATGLQPGYYQLRKQMSAAAALDMLLSPSSRLTSRVTVPEGATVAEVLQLYADETKLAMAALRKAAGAPKLAPLPDYARGNPEGFLFPSTYEIDPGTTADGAISAMVAQFTKQAEALGFEAGARRLGLTTYQALIVASLVEEEAGVPGDFPKVARVVYNRLEAGMPLQFDSTLNYVLAQRKLHLTFEDIRTPSRYNTYLHAGLPPTPISNPGLRALRAALEPAPGDWLYFVAIDKKGHSAFTASYSEFLRLKAEAKRRGVLK